MAVGGVSHVLERELERSHLFMEPLVLKLEFRIAIREHRSRRQFRNLLRREAEDGLELCDVVLEL